LYPVSPGTICHILVRRLGNAPSTQGGAANRGGLERNPVRHLLRHPRTTDDRWSAREFKDDDGAIVGGRLYV
jgi:hypothetical protein